MQGWRALALGSKGLLFGTAPMGLLLLGSSPSNGCGAGEKKTPSFAELEEERPE